MKTFNKKKYLSDIKKLDNLNLYQYKDLDKIVKLLTITYELYTEMFRDQKFQVSSCMSN